MGGFLSGRTSLTTVQTADIAANAITLAKLAGGTDGNIISYDASGDPVAIVTGNDGQVLHSAGAGAQPAFETISAGFTQGTAIATTSGTAATFTGIPAGTDLIVMNLVGVSTDSNSQLIRITLGDSGGLETSGYLGCSAKIEDETVEEATVRHTVAFGLGNENFDAADVVHGHCIFCLENASTFTWTYTGMLGGSASGGDNIYFGTGSKSLSAELTQISFSTSSPATFDAGAINIMYQ